MSAESNIETIKAVYAAFGKGDMSGILEVLSDDIDWATEAASTAAPWYGVRHGKQQVAAFFSEFSRTMRTDEFTLLAYTASGDDVMTVVRHRSHSIVTGRSVDMNQHHWFTFNNGKITHHRASEDTAQVEAALRS
ncbi:nuclear transport factor 2 family protein [Actinospica robiniae]|uniref:nuclear transport factor 2 family protein n=1 Tax=Actinospica robiniae TaxID=304901 RepID=UPI000401EB6C|nr:nuclear transport factor 2 family protein [Actinospica robiniae]